MARVTEHTREGGTHYIEPKKQRNRRDSGVSEPQQEEQSDADDTSGNRGED